MKKNQALKVPSGRMFLSFELDFAVREARLEWLFVTAPTSGPYESMLFIKDRAQPAAGGSTMTGNTSMNMTGIIYLPNESLTFSGGAGTSSAYTTIVVDTLKINGNAYVNANYTSLSGCVPGPRVARLIE